MTTARDPDDVRDELDDDLQELLDKHGVSGIVSVILFKRDGEVVAAPSVLSKFDLDPEKVRRAQDRIVEIVADMVS